MFTKAEKKKSKLRLAITSPSGGGKTFSALRIAKGLGGKIAFIDTENSANKYADRFDFDCLQLSSESHMSEFIDAINYAGKNGYEIIVIDSMSHCWDSLLDTITKVAAAKFHGNSFSAWGDKAGGKFQNDFTNTILTSTCHIIATFRQKTEYVLETTSKGTLAPKRVGTEIKQKNGIEYEFDMVLEGNLEHFFTVTKDRTGKFQDSILEKPSEKFGQDLSAWLNDGVEGTQTLATPKPESNPEAIAQKQASPVEQKPVQSTAQSQAPMPDRRPLATHDALEIQRMVLDYVKQDKIKATEFITTHTKFKDLGHILNTSKNPLYDRNVKACREKVVDIISKEPATEEVPF